MKNRIFSIIAFLALIIFQFQCFAQNLYSDKVEGIWSGTLELPGTRLEIIFKISTDSNGTLTSKMDVPMQGAKDIQVAETVVAGDSLKLIVTLVSGEFLGRFENDSVVDGKWSQSGMSFPITLERTLPAQINRPQTPQPPFPYMSEDVEYMNSKSGLKLAGTLTIPENANNCPAVILISGSGAQDRDETIFDHKPFLVIADYLTRKGIAVLRVDDRGVGGSGGDIGNATTEDFAGDVLAGIEFLKNRNETDPEKIGLIGHSEGGLIAPLAASESNDVAFIVLMAGPGVSGEQILYEQSDLSIKAAGLSQEVADQNRQLQEAIFDIVLNEKDSTKRIERLQQTYTGGVYGMMNNDQKAAIDARVTAVDTPWFRYFLTYDPYPVLTKVKCPVLALNGSKDIQVPADTNLPAINNALTEGGNKNFETIELENLNHLFQHCTTGAATEYSEIEETISPGVLEIINDWIWKILN